MHLNHPEYPQPLLIKKSVLIIEINTLLFCYNISKFFALIPNQYLNGSGKYGYCPYRQHKWFCGCSKRHLDC